MRSPSSRARRWQRTLLIFGHDQDPLEKGVHGFAEPGQGDKGGPVVSLGRVAHDDLADCQEGLVELPLFGAEVITGRACLFPRFRMMLTTRLKAMASGCEVGIGLELLHGPDLLLCPDEILNPRGQYGVHDVVGMALGEELVFKPAPEELQDIGLRLFGGALQKPAEDGEALVDQGVEGKRVALLEDDVDDAEGLAAQGIGVGRPGGDQADAEEAADRIQSCRRC